MARIISGRCQTAKISWTEDETRRYMDKGDIKNKRAKQCRRCEYNREGYCSKLNEWCDKARVECSKCVEKTSDYDLNGRFISRIKRKDNNKRIKSNSKKKHKKNTKNRITTPRNMLEKT